MATPFADIVGRVRRLIDQTDLLAATALQDGDIIAVIADQIDDLGQGSQIGNFQTMTYDLGATSPTFGITPAPSIQESIILALATGIALLEDTYRGRLDRGELGISWRSGPEEQSSIAAARAYKTLIDEKREDLTSKILIYTKTLTGQRMT